MYHGIISAVDPDFSVKFWLLFSLKIPARKPSTKLFCLSGLPS